MSANELIRLLSQLLFITIAFQVGVEAVRRRRKPIIDAALLFGVAALVAVDIWFGVLLRLDAYPLHVAFRSASFMAIPYLLVRLVDDYVGLPRWLRRLVGVATLLAAASFFVFPIPQPSWMTGAHVLIFVATGVLAAIAFGRGATGARGVTRRRMQAGAVGGGMLAVTILFVGLRIAFPRFGTELHTCAWITSLAAGLAYFIGFVPPEWLRSAWQAPGLRAFVNAAVEMAGRGDVKEVTVELQRCAALALGSRGATIWVWDPSAGALCCPGVAGAHPPAPREAIVNRVFQTQQAEYVDDLERDNPAMAERYRAMPASAILAAPITVGERRIGVLAVFSSRAPVFADDDLAFVQILAGQVAVVLEGQRLAAEAAAMRAREEAARLKDEFLAGAAHDLKTPLTAILAGAELLERRSVRRPDEPVDLRAVQRVVRDAKRMSRLVYNLLESARADAGLFAITRVEADLVQLANEVCAECSAGPGRCRVEAPDPVTGGFDASLVAQLIANLVDNAIKYSPGGEPIVVRVWRDGAEARISVEDRGIGIEPGEVARLFERFQRGTNAKERHISGLGLGLHICRAIAEQHGGRIWAETVLGGGSTFHVALPLVATDARTPQEATGG